MSTGPFVVKSSPVRVRELKITQRFKFYQFVKKNNSFMLATTV